MDIESNSGWELLPVHIWENIFSFLPISGIIRSKIVCKTWRSIIDAKTFLSVYKKVAHRDIFFILFADFYYNNVVAAYHPLDNKWILIPLSHISSNCPSTCCKLRRTLISNSGLVLAEDHKGSMLLCNIFNGSYKTLPPMMAFVWPYPISMIVDVDDSYKIISVSTSGRILSQIYDSKTGCWEAKGVFEGRFAMLGNAVFLNGLLFCLSLGPDCLLSFDPMNGSWNLLDVVVPQLACSHILVHEGDIILVGGVEEDGMIKRIGIWKLDKLEKQWHEVCSMPQHLFDRFNNNLNRFDIVDYRGVICFCKSGPFSTLLCDLSSKRWWWPPPCPLDSYPGKKSWFGHAIEPRLDLLL